VNQPGLLLFGANRRSGTTWLTGMLNYHPQVHIRNEGWFVHEEAWSMESWLNRERVSAWAATNSARGTWLKDLGLPEAVRVMQRGMIRELLREAALRETWKPFEQLRWLGDKTTNFYLQKIEYVHHVFPDAAFLCMVRDGRDAVVSDLFLLFREGRFDDLGTKFKDRLQRAMAFHCLGRGEPVPLFEPETLRYFIDLWARSIVGGFRARELYGPRMLTVRYEDLVADPTSVVEVYRWLGVSDDPELVANAVETHRFENYAEGRKRGQGDPLAEWRKGIVGDWRNYFTQDDKDVFKHVAGSLLVELGYERDLAW
jgi:hypothetical protein